MPSYYFNVLSAAEAYLFNGTAAAHGDETSALLYALANDLVIEVSYR